MIHSSKFKWLLDAEPQETIWTESLANRILPENPVDKWICYSFDFLYWNKLMNILFTHNADFKLDDFIYK